MRPEVWKRCTVHCPRLWHRKLFGTNQKPRLASNFLRTVIYALPRGRRCCGPDGHPRTLWLSCQRLWTLGVEPCTFAGAVRFIMDLVRLTSLLSLCSNQSGACTGIVGLHGLGPFKQNTELLGLLVKASHGARLSSPEECETGNPHA